MIGLSRAGCVALVTALTMGALAPARATVGDGPDPGAAPEDLVGAWTGPFGREDAPPGALRAAVLGDGRVLYLIGNQPGLLDLRSGSPQFVPTAAPEEDADLSSPSLTVLADGRILLVGGTASRLFDPATGSFSSRAPLRHGRSYPQVAVGADGRPTVFGGAAAPRRVRRTETYNPERNAWGENYAGGESESELPLEPRIVLAPDGRFFYAAAGQMGGPDGPAPDDPATALFQFFDTGTKKWKIAGAAPLGARSGAFVVPLTLQPPYDRMTIVTFGGVVGPAPALPASPLTTLTAIDADGAVSNQDSGRLRHARWHSSGVLLPDGKILAVGGADQDDALMPGLGRPVMIPELYDPSTGLWSEMAPHRTERGYHHSALLLPDMRVLVGGADPGFEVWSPPYLFRGPRPSVSRVQKGVGYRETFDINTPDAGLVESVLLLRTPSPEHANDSDQRALELEFSRRGPDLITATAPPSGAVAPPGPYYLVITRKSLQGPVPSVARIVRVGLTDRAEAPQPYPDDPPAPAAPAPGRRR
jgi:hypothetical protein